MRNSRKADRRRLFTDKDCQHLVLLIKQWPATQRLTWGMVGAIAEENLRYRWTRQTLSSNSKLRKAYDLHSEIYAKSKKGIAVRSYSPQVETLRQRIQRLETENSDLIDVLKQYDERLVRYLANAARHGVTQEQLEAPLIAISRA